MRRARFVAGLIWTVITCPIAAISAQNYPPPREGDFTVHDFHFKDGETLPELRLHYATLGTPIRNSAGVVTNAVLLLHGTTASWNMFFYPSFAGELFGPGQPLDATKFFLILPDSIGHGHSSKPSAGLRMHFPHYDFDDMVAAQHALLTQGLGVNHLRLVLGTSMGGMHSWVWGETYPDFMDTIMPMACLPVQVGGRNYLWRKEIKDLIRFDPAWKNGDYTEEPRESLRAALSIVLISASAPLYLQQHFPTPAQAGRYLDGLMQMLLGQSDANDMLYAFDSSRNYDPSSGLQIIKAPLMLVNSADDFINPPELGIAEREIKRVKRGKYVLLPMSEWTQGHGTFMFAAVWKAYLEQLLTESSKPPKGATPQP